MKNYLGMAAAVMAGVTLVLAASPALARTDVDINIGIPGVVYAQPQPVYVQPQPVYVQPRPVYVQPRPVYVQPRPVYVERHHHREWREQAAYARRDRDGDGVPNRFDRRPDNPYRY
jgi:hypothetical protein